MEEVQETTDVQENAELTDEQIDAMSKEGLDTLLSTRLNETTDSGDAESESAEGQEEEAASEDSTEETEGEAEPEEEETEEEPEPEPVPNEELEKLRAHSEKQEKFIQRQSNEVGDLRKQVRELQSKLSETQSTAPEFTPEEREKINDLYHSDPLAAREMEDQIRRKRESAKKEAVESRRQAEKDAQMGLLNETIPDWEDKADTVKNFLAENNFLDRRTAEDFAADPSGFAHGAFVFKMAAEAAESSSSVTALEAKVKELTSRLVATQKKIKSAATKKPSMPNAGSSSAATAMPELTDEQIDAMSKKQLDELLKRWGL